MKFEEVLPHSLTTHKRVIERFRKKGVSFKANDNISEHITEHELSCIQKALEQKVEEMLEVMLIDTVNDHNTKGTAQRVAKMFIHEVYAGRYKPAPKITDFPNYKNLDEMYVTGPITVRSACSHHLVPIVGKCWIGVIPGDRVIGLSKFNRIVEWVAARPQIQEELVVQIADYIEKEIQPVGLAVIVEATHMCMTWRGVRESSEATMTTSVMRGAFKELPHAKAELLSLIGK
jgi:GTP cyclohydrolase I